ncbi:MAG: silent information regulator protein Sir2 [Bacteroidota bacterium]|nr:silent information regulator protein Sir2 [Bacteroidota bacterium]
MNKLTIVIFSGAGLSTESGIPTFRDSGGLWEQHRVEDVASPEGWLKNKKLVLDFYAQRFLKQLECHPNPAHLAIAKLSERHNVVNITQNIDTLLERAGNENVWHLHGRIDFQKCEHHRSSGFLRDSGFECDYQSFITKPIQMGDLCPKCGGQLRPDIVWFGEPVDMRENELMKLKQSADIFIGVGTSAQVYPAAGLLPMFRSIPKKYFIDPNPAYEMLEGYDVLKGSASEQMPKLVEKLL